MRTKAIGFSSFLTLIIILFTGCFSVNLTMPVYEMKNGDEINENTIVIINDIEYRMQPEQKWSINPGEIIGYAGTWKIEVLEAEGDTKRNFICLFDTSQFWDKQYAIFHRTDLPEPSSDSVSMISYYEQDFRGEKIQRLTNIISDENTIKELFEETDNGTRIFDVSHFNGVSIVLSCYSDLGQHRTTDHLIL